MDRRRRPLAARFLFFSGKGGVGKTTCAAAAATAAALDGARVLALSTDPAHSLGDVLGQRLSMHPSLVPLRGRRSARRGSLAAAELDARRAFARWLASNRRALGDIVEHGTWLDRADVDALLGLSIPGIDELVGLIEIRRLADAAVPVPYDLVVVDTAPTGHTLRLLAAPSTVAAVARALDSLQEEHRAIRRQLGRTAAPEAADRLIEVLAQQARETAGLLKDPRRASFQWVTLPEELSLAESEDGIGALAGAGIRVEGVIVNRITPNGPPCPICDRRRFAEQRAIAGVKRRLGRGRAVRLAPAVRPEPRGVAALAAIGARLTARGGPATATKIAPRETRRASGRSARDMAMSLPRGARTVSPESLETLDGARLLFFGGKGGVGKTTTAAAVALKLARVRPERAVLLLSTDPAHSLGDVFAEAIGDEPTPVRGGPPNLMVREVDAAATLAARRAGLEAAFGEISETFGASGVTLATGGRGAAELMDLAPPGIDELFGLLSVVEARDRFPLIVLDTAPTGHALRLLEMPDAAHEWVQLLLRVLLKYRSIVRPGQLAAELVEVSKSIRALQTLLHNARDTRFVVVTRAAAVARSETGRLLRSLARLRLAAPAIVVNAVTLAPGRCPNCRATAITERREMAELGRQRICAGCVIIQTPLAAPPPRGLAALDRWAESWLADEPPRKSPRPSS